MEHREALVALRQFLSTQILGQDKLIERLLIAPVRDARRLWSADGDLNDPDADEVCDFYFYFYYWIFTIGYWISIGRYYAH